MKKFVLLAALALIVAACTDSGEATPTLATGTTTPTTTIGAPTAPPTTPPTTPTPTTGATQTTAPSSTTADPATTIPIPNTEGESDFVVIWNELIEYHNWAFQNPELADPKIYLSEDCACFPVAMALFDEYLTNGWHETSPGLTVHDVDVDISSSTFALMTVVDEHSALVVVDEDGIVVRERERRPKTFYDVRVRLTEDGWRIAEWFQRGAVGDAE